MLPRGRRVRLETLLNGLLLVSGNDAAIALADHIAGTERRFVALMNERARAARARMHALRVVARPRGAATARARATWRVLTRLAMKRQRIRRIVRRRQAAFRFPIKGGRLYLSGHNPLIRAGYPGRSGSRPATPTRRACASWGWPGAVGERSPWCCCTRPTR